MNIQASTLRPGLLVSLKTSVVGNVRYTKQTIELERVVDALHARNPPHRLDERSALERRHTAAQHHLARPVDAHRHLAICVVHLRPGVLRLAHFTVSLLASIGSPSLSIY